MTKQIKLILKIFIAIVILIAVIVGALISIYLLSDPNQYKQVISQKFEEFTGTKIEMDGDFQVSLFPQPSFALQQVNLFLPAIDGRDISVQAETIDVKVSWSTFSSEDFEIQSLSSTKGTINIHEKGKSAQKYPFDKVSAKVNKTAQGLKLNSLNWAHGISNFEGHLTYTHGEGQRSKLAGELESSNLDLDNLIPTQKAKIPASQLIPAIDIPFDAFKGLDYDLSVTIHELPLKDSPVKDLRFKFKSENGHAQIHPFTAKLHEGTLEGTVELFARQNKVVATLRAQQWSLEDILAKGEDVSGIEKGRFDLTFSGSGHGKTLRQVLGNWDGKALWVLGETVIKNQRIKGNISDVALSMFSFLNPFKSKQTDTHLQCAVMNYTIKNGTAFALNKVAAETKFLDALGSGQINLNNEKIDFEFNLRKKQGIDLSFGHFDKYLRVEGTLKEPTVQFNPKGMVQEGASIFSAIATGGVSLLAEKVFDNLSKSKHPCEAALSEN